MFPYVSNSHSLHSQVNCDVNSPTMFKVRYMTESAKTGARDRLCESISLKFLRAFQQQPTTSNMSKVRQSTETTRINEYCAQRWFLEEPVSSLTLADR
jgi:hypothetical protein